MWWPAHSTSGSSNNTRKKVHRKTANNYVLALKACSTPSPDRNPWHIPRLYGWPASPSLGSIV